MKNKIEKLLTCLISLVVITSFLSLSMRGINTNVDDFSFSAPKLSAQDTFWPSNSSEWTEVAPEEQGLDSNKISEMFEFIEENFLDIHSIIIVRNGYLLTEEYLNDYQIYRYIDNSKTYFAGETLHGQYSTTKSFMSILIGIALQEGFLDNVNQTLYEIFADIWEPSFTNSTLKKDITIEHLLTMTSGLGDWQIPDGDTKHAADCITFILDEVPLAFTPGEVGGYAYTNEGPTLLSGIITKVTGKSAEEFAKEYLFTPLGISEEEYYFDHDAKNISFGGSGLECTPKVQAKLGILSLNNDQHWGWPLPQFLYENHLVSADVDFNFYGYTVPGLPYPIVGFNEYVGWGETIFPADTLDWYFFDTINEDQYIYNGTSVAFTEREYDIKVKGKSPVKLIVKDTVHGPVLSDVLGTNQVPDSLEDSNIVLTAKWVPNDITFEWQAIWEMIHSQNREEFDDASRLLDVPPMNIVYGDVDGNIAIRPTGKVPIRDDSRIPEGYYGNGSLPYNGSNGEGEWIGYVPFDELPNTLNPAQNYLVSANQVAAGPDYKKYYLHNSYAPSYRARRINNVLNTSADGSISVSDMMTLQSDVTSTGAASYTPYIIYTIENNYGSSPPSQIAEILALLKEWDYVMDKDLAAPTIYRKWRAYFYDFTFDDEYTTYNAQSSPDWTLLEYFMKEKENSHWFDNISTSSVIETRDDIMLKALVSTIEWLGDFFGTEDASKWRWGDLHKLYFSSITGMSALSKGPYDGDGEAITINPSPVNIKNGVGYSGGGAAHRLIIDFSNISNSRSCISGGASGLSHSNHYADQLEQLFLQGKYHYTYIQYTLTTFPSSVIESIIYFNPTGE